MKFDFVEVIEKYGLWGFIILVTILIILSMVRSNWFGDLISNTTTKIMSKFMKNKTKNIKTITVKDSDIKNHDIFNFIDFSLYAKISILEFKSTFRNLVFKKYLKIYLNSFRKNIKNYVDAGDFKEMDNAELLTSVQNLIITIIKDYETESYNNGIPKIIIDKMRIKNNPRLAFTIDLVKDISSSEFYHSEFNMLKIHSILNILQSSLENTINTSKEVSDDINGGLKGVTFEGVTEK